MMDRSDVSGAPTERMQSMKPYRPRRVPTYSFPETATRYLACFIRTNAFVMCWLVASIPCAWGVERVTLRNEAGTQQLEGEIQVEDEQGGLLLLTADGRLWPCGAARIESRSKDDVPFKALNADEMSQRLLQEFGAGFQIHKTAHYVVAHNTNDAYVKWCAGLFERLHRGFYTFWKSRGWVLKESRFPLVAVVFDSREAFERYAKPEVGEGVGSIIGYYNLQTNRMTTYALADPERRVATVIHEAVHQLAYNSSLQRRLADNPLWVSEGLAMYFEAPDLSNSRGWGTIGKVNEVNLGRFREYLPSRPADSLPQLIQDDRRFSGSGAGSAYGEAWALNYFLLRTKPKQYVNYLQGLSQRPPLEATDSERRLDEFATAFGDPQKLNAEFLRYMRDQLK